MTKPNQLQLSLLGIFFLLLSGCSTDTNDEIAVSVSLAFDESSLPTEDLPADGGDVVLDVNWANTNWTVKAGDAVSGEKFISQITPGSGGDADKGDSQTTVTVSFSANQTMSANQQKIILRSYSGGQADTIILKQAAKPTPKINISLDPNTSYQTISGFGGANMIWGTDYLSESEMNLAFGTGDDDLGLSILRVRLSSDKNDWAGLVNTIKLANERKVKVLASPWSPPAEWKSNSSTDGGGHLQEEHYADFANYINEFIQYMDSQGATVDVVSIQNEPDWLAGYEGCEYTIAQLLNFMKNNAGSISGAKVLAAESLNSNHAYTDDILNDPNAAANLDIVGGHLYGSGLTSYPLAVQKGKEIWMTEHLLNLDSGNNPDNWTADTPVGRVWNETMEMVTEIQTCLSYNWNAYIWWYIRRYYSFLGDGERGTTRGQILKRGYAMSQFSKFIRPGYVRIKAELDNTTTALSLTAYQGDDKLVIVVVNPSDSEIPEVTIALPSSASLATAYTTSELVNRKKELLVSNDSGVGLNIPAKSIITIVVTN
ncbi:glycoside hydrolase [Mangrovibacterium marinum]|uniref:O-glycosyl hydrolase n=1 Tax=Mangrovibacterium marinum TaxID=1639118 RepID=A0A2T5C3T6_9BACT|nr:glycoside hydrolase [Mangrovibacterium marinum]PTN09471.1 O-glycosyl hydrolase [Mangrovibacterium marinum]